MTNKFIMVAYRQYCMNEDGLGHCAGIHTIIVAWKNLSPQVITSVFTWESLNILPFMRLEKHKIK